MQCAVVRCGGMRGGGAEGVYRKCGGCGLAGAFLSLRKDNVAVCRSALGLRVGRDSPRWRGELLDRRLIRFDKCADATVGVFFTGE